MDTKSGTESENIDVIDDELEQNNEIIRNSENTEIDSFETLTNVENDHLENDQEEENDDDDDLDSKKTSEDSASKVIRLTRLPISRIKSIMKYDDELTAASQEAVFIITKATELFIEELSKEMYQFTMANKKKTIQKRDVENAFWSQEYFTFLDGCFNE